MTDVHTWDDADPYTTLCGQPIQPGVLSTYNPLAVTCPACNPPGAAWCYVCEYPLPDPPRETA